MIKVEVIKEFTLARFNELKNVQRKEKEVQGRLFVGDIFECNADMVEYLTKTNALGEEFVKIIEIIPEKEKQEIKTQIKKETKIKKTIAKK